MSFPTETFQEHARRRKARGGGHAAINDRIRGFANSKRSSPSVRDMQQLEQRERQLDQREPMPPPNESNAVAQAGLDQGSRGGAEHAPPVTDANSWMRQTLRERREGNE